MYMPEIKAVLMFMLLIAAVEATPLYRKMQGTEVGVVSGIEYYVQVSLVGPYIQELIPAINTTYSHNFGSTQLFALNVTEGVDPSSKQLGYLRGYRVETSYTATGAGVQVEVLSYNDGILNGTVSMQALIVNDSNELAVVGGTGDFRGVRGYCIGTLMNATTNILIYHQQLYFM